jgi:hypothetical protein
VTWSGSDGDSATLLYQLQLSGDGGATWSPLIPLTDATSFSLDTTLIPSGTGQKLRVMVTDGFNTAYNTHNVSVTNPLTVTAVDPSDTATGVDTDATVSVAFGTDVNTSTLFAGFKMVVQGQTTGLGGTLTYDPVIQTVVFQPASSLEYNTTYVVSLTGVQDVHGNSLAAPYQWSFTTGPDAVAPLVAYRSPGPGDLDVPLSPLIVAQFSEFMTAGTVNGSSFTVTGPGGAVAGTVAYNSPSGFRPRAARPTPRTPPMSRRGQDLAGNPLQARTTGATAGTLSNAGGARLLDSYADQAVDEDGDDPRQAVHLHRRRGEEQATITTTSTAGFSTRTGT